MNCSKVRFIARLKSIRGDGYEDKRSRDEVRFIMFFIYFINSVLRSY